MNNVFFTYDSYDWVFHLHGEFVVQMIYASLGQVLLLAVVAGAELCSVLRRGVGHDVEEVLVGARSVVVLLVPAQSAGEILGGFWSLAAPSGLPTKTVICRTGRNRPLSV